MDEIRENSLSLVSLLAKSHVLVLEEEKNLLNQVLQGNEDAFRTLYDQYYNYLTVVGMRYLTDRMRVEDVINDLFVDLWKKNADVEIGIGVKQYLRGGVINKCLAILRKDSRMDYVDEHKERPSARPSTIEGEIDASQIQSVVDKTVEALPEKCRQVYQLSRVEGRSHKEISAEMNITTKTIENHMTRALKALRQALLEKGLVFWLIYLGSFGG